VTRRGAVAGLLAGLVAAVLAPLPARAEALLISLSVSRVAVNSSYTGSSIVVFGSVERDAQTVARAGGYDLVVTVRGPRQSLTVREKERLGPIWLNRAQQKFAEVPAFLAVLASRPLTALAGEPSRQRLRIGLDAIVASPDLTLASDRVDDPFRSALLRLRAGQKLFIEDEAAVQFLTPTLFRATVPLPATAPVGRYDVEAVLFASGASIARQESRFELVKTGFERRMAVFARDWAPAYGILAIGAALLFGWLASVIFRRD
jgi:uncharacterized protein (TIGR02186 family)